MNLDKLNEQTFAIIEGSVGNTEWWTEKDLDNHRKHVKNLKASGKLRETRKVTIVYPDCDLFSNDNKNISPLEWETKIITLDLKGFNKK